MTKKQTLEACRAIAPDFAIKLATINGQPCIIATCTVLGAPMELSHAIDGWPRAKIEASVLDSCLRSLRRKQEAAA